MGKKAVSSWAQPLQLFQLGKPTDLKSEFKVGFLKFTLWHPSNIHNKESQPTWTDMEQIACNKQHVSVLDIKTSSDHCMVTGELELWASLASPLPAVAARCSGLRTLKVNCIYSVPTGQVDCRPSQTMKRPVSLTNYSHLHIITHRPSSPVGTQIVMHTFVWRSQLWCPVCNTLAACCWASDVCPRQSRWLQIFPVPGKPRSVERVREVGSNFTKGTKKSLLNIFQSFRPVISRLVQQDPTQKTDDPAGSRSKHKTATDCDSDVITTYGVYHYYVWHHVTTV